MPIVPITPVSWLFVPPLDAPLQLRLENGRFDSMRPRRLSGPPSCATTHVIPGTDPANPTGEDVYFGTGLHQAVDLASVAGSCVYAAYSGRVVEVNRDRDATKGNVTIDHHPAGSGFLTQYLHISDIAVDTGDFVREGQPFAQVSAVPEEAHLHFELWVHLDGADPGGGAPGDGRTAPLDPTRALYAWEQRLVPDQEVDGPSIPVSVGLTRVHTVPFFVAELTHHGRLHVPLYEPLSVEERLIISLLRDAHRRQAALRLAVRSSPFWGLDVITQAELA